MRAINWVTTNFPLLSGVAVAFLSFLSSFINLFRERTVESKDIKKAKDYIAIYSGLSDGIQAKKNIELLLTQLTQKIVEQSMRKFDSSNMAAIIFVAVVGGGVSYLLALWATNVSGLFSVLIWIVFGTVFLFTIALSIAGWTLRYGKSSPKKEDE